VRPRRCGRSQSGRRRGCRCRPLDEHRGHPPCTWTQHSREHLQARGGEAREHERGAVHRGRVVAQGRSRRIRQRAGRHSSTRSARNPTTPQCAAWERAPYVIGSRRERPACLLHRTKPMTPDGYVGTLAWAYSTTGKSPRQCATTSAIKSRCSHTDSPKGRRETLVRRRLQPAPHRRTHLVSTGCRRRAAPGAAARKTRAERATPRALCRPPRGHLRHTHARAAGPGAGPTGSDASVMTTSKASACARRYARPSPTTTVTLGWSSPHASVGKWVRAARSTVCVPNTPRTA
jgi:hypothetical protein